jgi:multidrug efflux system membrane fusion protein
MRTPRFLLLAGAIIAAGAVAWLALTHASVHASAPPAAPVPAVPVSAAPAKTADVPVYLHGLGTVQAFNTLEVKAQVSGTLIALPVREGEEVQKGAVLAEIDPRPYEAALDQAQAKLAGDQATATNDEVNLKRDAMLARSDFASRQQVDNDRAALLTAQANIQADQAAIAAARLNVEFCTIKAPFNGRVGFYQTDVGNLIEVTTQTGILSLTQDKPISVVFTLPEADLKRVQAAMAHGSLQVLAYGGDDRTRLAEGSLMTPNNMIDTSTGTIGYKAVFQNQNDELWPGEFVNARLRVETLHNAVTVPLAAIQHGPDGLFVFTVGPDARVQQRTVDVAYQDNDIAVIGKGVQAGQQVVLEGQSRLAPGKLVALNAPPPARAGSQTAAGADPQKLADTVRAP